MTVVKILEFALVFLYVKLPFALHLHDQCKSFSDASFTSWLDCDVVCDLEYFVYCIAWADSASACLHYRNIRKVISEIHHFFSLESMLEAEGFEVLDFSS